MGTMDGAWKHGEMKVIDAGALEGGSPGSTIGISRTKRGYMAQVSVDRAGRSTEVRLCDDDLGTVVERAVGLLENLRKRSG